MEENTIMEEEIYEILRLSVSNEHAKALMMCEEFVDHVVEDIKLTSAYEEDGTYSDDDIRFSIGRALCWKLGVYLY